MMAVRVAAVKIRRFFICVITDWCACQIVFPSNIYVKKHVLQSPYRTCQLVNEDRTDPYLALDVMPWICHHDSLQTE